MRYGCLGSAEVLKTVRSAPGGPFLESFIWDHIIELFSELSPRHQRAMLGHLIRLADENG
jgi:hypothetical protein